MSTSLSTLSPPAIPQEVRNFAREKGVTSYLNDVVTLAQQAFPSSELGVSLGHDAEDELHQYVAIDVDSAASTTEELLAGQRAWFEGITGVCPSRFAVHFVLGWR